jgi:hypothetical protein
MRKPTEAEYQLMAAAAMDRLGDEGAQLLTAVFQLSEKRGWSLRELAAHLEGATGVVKGMVAGWIDDEDTKSK